MDEDSTVSNQAGQMNLPPSSTGVLLIAHGSRREAANSDLVRLAEMVQAGGDYDVVEFAYLELVEPTIPQGVRACVERGCRRVLMLPYFLSAGAHVTEDLQRYRKEFENAFPEVSFILCPPLGLHPLIVDVVLERLRESAEPT